MSLLLSASLWLMFPPDHLLLPSHTQTGRVERTLDSTCGPDATSLQSYSIPANLWF